MKNKAAILNNFTESHNKVWFHIAQLYTGEGSEFKGYSRKFLKQKKIEKKTCSSKQKGPNNV